MKLHPKTLLNTRVVITYRNVNGLEEISYLERTKVIKFHQIDWASLDKENNVIFINCDQSNECLPVIYSSMRLLKQSNTKTDNTAISDDYWMKLNNDYVAEEAKRLF